MELAILSSVAVSAAVNVFLLVLLKRMLQNHHDQIMNELKSEHQESGKHGKRNITLSD
ncbi:MAG: hypothetical protein RR842_14120 [Gordonibacter sp.]|uniref:hypothetical protein n=1 Tax=Gordonibacter sp. TaxID=1968902 RepID=UPI002FC7BCFC